jgi:(1->4)-alpha-D-glucan 1-alpha-D-glucosylmutase
MKSRTSSIRSTNRRPNSAPALLRNNEGGAKRPAEASAQPNPERRAFTRIPGATYRLQFNASFTLQQARELVDYLEALGITDIYASPLFTAGPGSTHGYDTCSHSEIGSCLGGEAAFDALAAELRRRGMGLLLDIVPNHMGACSANAWWWDVLKHGRASSFARYFDIDWERGHGRVLLPVLGKRLPEVIRAGELKLVPPDQARGEWRLAYFDNLFPLAPGTAPETWGELSPETWLALLDAQHYRLAYWRVGPHEINYRRFFDVTGLVALRMEDETIFEATHDKLFALLSDGKVTGLRVDHPDGLRDPRGYFERLQNAAQRLARNRSKELYIVAEKILCREEELPREWRVAGTTGYDFLVQVNSLFVARDNVAAMTDVYRAFTGIHQPFPQLAYESRKRVLELSFAAEVDALAEKLHVIAETTLAGRDVTAREWRAAVIELIANFDVYRTYVTAEATACSAQDAAVLRHAVDRAIQRNPSLAPAIEFLHSVLSLEAAVPAAEQPAAREFVLRFQQLSGPAAAKGIEDTAFYNDFRLVSLNEVGGEPEQFGISIEQFHENMERRAATWPHSLLATATHDTKRGEDTRARINVLSEMPEEWREHVFRWRDLNSAHKTLVSGTPAPDGNDEYLFYQTIVGACPPELLRDAPASAALESFRERVAAYMLKAIKEAKRHTSWTEPNEAYEQATQRFVERVLSAENSSFFGSFVPLARRVALVGAIHSLSQTLIKLTAPGVPDFYQGSELEDFSLVDPDNRRPVDFNHGRECLRSLSTSPIPEIRSDNLGPAKLWLIHRVLQFRREHRDLVDFGTYRPLALSHEHIVAFLRQHQGGACLVLAPRLFQSVLKGPLAWPPKNIGWGDDILSLPASAATEWRNVLTDEVVRSSESSIADLLSRFPVALLHKPY